MSSEVKNESVLAYEGRPVYSCSKCSAVITLQDELISKTFSGREGRGLLAHSATNVRLGKKEDRPLMTGVHTVADITCLGCGDRLGWFYHKAADPTQKYKEGKYVLEKEKLVKENNWTLE
ncbi:yippee zinc-binding/DNA-binding /Mis18, centromere assembly-domain-containing protein [Schizophyllum amplum]|uniref:Protein yippee-like n=1 Tax=Schizophyllum amplum TaxID=97359 RepID=A0A550CZ10_9AGAR|nr:yippee zinc-binding/DNA-binding /Mis18, centromere assembly-domain-containing protein [Auriculariopsis ampla]